MNVSQTDDSHSSSRGVVLAIGLIAVAYFMWWGISGSGTDSHHTEQLEQTVATGEHDPAEAATPPPAFYSVLPFIVLLGAIAILPLFRKTEHWWEHNQNRFLVACSLGLLTLLYYTFLYGHGVHDHFTHGHHSEAGFDAAVTVLKNAILVEYIPFIVLLFSLYVISGGIHIGGHLAGKPKLNAGILGLGGLIASFIGTTGAAMLLIRPLIRANEERKYVAHTMVFFIFVVCNTGGCLLPIGDPPLFLGYLRGVDFLWTLNLWPMWLTMNLALIAIYFVYDLYKYRKESKPLDNLNHDNPDPLSIEGGMNFAWLLGVIFCVALLDPSRTFPGTEWKPPVFLREVLMLILTAISLQFTTHKVRQKNLFNFAAIIEVAALFIGIFICMQAPIQILNEYGPDLGFDVAWKFFWGTGTLSSFLDNAPTYVVFFETAKTVAVPEAELVAGVTRLHLVAISLGAVFMGSMTYIGNGPNFMVKAIAEKNNIRMPSFFGYIFYSVLFVLPVCVLICAIFLRE